MTHLAARWAKGGRQRLWVAATAATAAGVFIATFVVVSAATGGDHDATVRIVPDERVVTTPPSTAAPEPIPASRSAPAPTPEPGPLPAPPARAASSLPAFDEDALTYGGTGEQGATLAGHGIVDSSSPDRRTPWEVIIPSARIKASVRRVGLTPGGAFGAPDNPEVIGWWEAGPAPGEQGNVLLDGHRDYEDIYGNVGTGVCWLLPNTTVGDFIIIRDQETQTAYLYTVIEAASVAFDDPAGVAYLQPSEEAILTLITCEGSFDSDAKNYSNRRILVAELTDSVALP